VKRSERYVRRLSVPGLCQKMSPRFYPPVEETVKSEMLAVDPAWFGQDGMTGFA
jgi:hypothetical protein